MKYVLLVYIDPALTSSLPAGEADTMMRTCLDHADALTESGKLVDFQQLEPVQAAKSVRIRNGKVSVVDGPFAETKELLGGFNLIEADSLDEALAIAAEFPWAKTGCIEVRPLCDIDAVRRRVGAEPRQPG